MDYSNSLLYMPLMTGIIFAVTGIITMFYPPKKINMMYGYRTSSSMKSKERWDFAQKYSSVLIIYCGLGLIILSGLGLVYNVSEGKSVFIGTIEIILVAVFMFYKTEKAIKDRFDNE